jgi:Fe-S oxidoreductase/nitrate reductase gamma subunit
MNMTEASREILWNVSHGWLMYVLLVPTAVIGLYGIHRRVRLWRMGLPEARFDRPLKRLGLVFRHAVIQSRIAADVYPGMFHRLIFYGFLVAVGATTVTMVHHDFDIQILKGRFYLYFQSFLVDFFGLLMLIGIAMAAFRRWVSRPGKLVYSIEASIILAALLVMVITGFLLEGWRIAATEDPWAAWSFVGWGIAHISRHVMDPETLRSSHLCVWWLHLILAFGFLAWAPYTKMFHVLASGLNIYTANLAPTGANLKPVDFEGEKTFGVRNLTDFTWKDLLDLDACTECGRCTDSCPANTAGKVLSPRDIILDLRLLMHSGKGLPGDTNMENEATILDISSTLAPEALWECTTCGACVEVCPVFIEQMPKIIDMRRYLVMEEANLPVALQEAVMSLEKRGHPFRGIQSTRLDWADGLEAPSISENEDAEILLWVGSAGALQERSQNVTRTLAKLLKHADVPFAVLGEEERSTGDLARRLGNEFLFEMLAKETIDLLDRHRVKRIVTPCPHSFNTFRNEYPRLGARYEVYHHSEYLLKLVKAGKLAAGSATSRRITFHDPCYLGRHNRVFDPPRELLRTICNSSILEMKNNREKSFCCGGGGGMSFADEPSDKRVNHERACQALETEAEVVAVACPYCMTMLEDGIKAVRGERDIRVMDIAELLFDVLEFSR